MKRIIMVLLFFCCLQSAFCATPMKPFIQVTRAGSTSVAYIQASQIVQLALYGPGVGIWCTGQPATSGPTLIVSDTIASIIAACLAAE